MAGYSGGKAGGAGGYSAGGENGSGHGAAPSYGKSAASGSYRGAGKMPGGQYGAKGAGKKGAMPYMPNQGDISMIFGTQNYIAMLYKNGMVEVYNSGGKSQTYMPDGSVKEGASLDSLLESYRQGGSGMGPAGDIPYGAGKAPIGGMPYGPGMPGYDPLGKPVPSYGDITDKLGKGSGSYSGAPADGAKASPGSDKKGDKPSELMKKAPSERYSDMSKAPKDSKYGAIPSSTVPIPGKADERSGLEKAVAYTA